MHSRLKEFLHKESSVGILLMLATVLAIVFANTALHDFYKYILETPFEVRLGRHLHIAKPLLLWVNDGLMAIFFLLVGLEVKREMLVGQLSSRAQVVLPGIAAIGGMVMPALCYVLFNFGDVQALNGWAIPAATDIAFALGVLALLGDRVPSSMKIFLLALAIMDDLGAIVIIALFYSGDLSTGMLLLSAGCLALLVLLNLFRVENIAAYGLVGVFLWIFVLKSGVHATLAGVALAFAIPMKSRTEGRQAPAQKLEHDLHPLVNFVILPVFAFANAGIPLAGMKLGDLFHPVPLGIMAGLVVGKLVGVYGASILAVRLGFAGMPVGANSRHLLGVSALCGIGFTMSLFIGGLAFEHVGGDAASYLLSHRLGIIGGSLVAGLLGCAILWNASGAGSFAATSTSAPPVGDAGRSDA